MCVFFFFLGFSKISNFFYKKKRLINISGSCIWEKRRLIWAEMKHMEDRESRY